ncbi:MAG TPA: transcription-repair coupling factor [Planctomycetia bacterium]|nr:transcription-repair coupling factor [Planctomycetia bacterium]
MEVVMKTLLKLIRSNEKFLSLLRDLKAGGNIRAGGLWGSSAAYLLSALAEDAPSQILVVTGSVEEAEEFCEDVNLFRPGTASLFHPWEGFSTEKWRPSIQLPPEHLQILRLLLFDKDSAGNSAGRRTTSVIVCSVQALLQKLPKPDTLLINTLKISVGDEMEQQKILSWLTDRGFNKVSRVESPGEYSLRGGIMDIYQASSDRPIRIEFFGDTVESVRVFNPDTQMSVERQKDVNILALRDEPSSMGEDGSLFDYLPGEAWTVLREPAQIEKRALKTTQGWPQDRPEGQLHGQTQVQSWTLDYALIKSKWSKHTTLSLSFLPEIGKGPHNFEVESVERFEAPPPQTDKVLGGRQSQGSELAAAISALNELGRFRTQTRQTIRAIILCANEAEEKRFQELLADAKIIGLELAIGRLGKGFYSKDAGLILLPHHEIFHRYRIRRRPRQIVPSRPIESLLELERGDCVVHVTHGIAIFHGIETIEHEGQRRECLVLEFDGGSMLYVSGSKMDLVQKYIGPREHCPPLSRLGGQGWSRRLKEVEQAVTDLAGELLEIQALRQTKPGIKYPGDTEWQKEFEAEFPYEETEDQLKVSQEIKTDMERRRPMDRLVCGDVGYGKTELAVRATFKAVLHGKQVAVLVPTTILAQQHYGTFCERMADYPVRVEVLSRFKTRSEQKAVLEALAQGAVDVVIGTHRLAQRDVRFKDLGLVVIDEEQRFGVEHKERLKKLRQMVDVLTLTATPIPRTLHMSLLGLRDISSLSTPPQDRQAINTILMRYDPQKIRQAILFELNREGQVYFVHNRVYNIEQVADELSRIVPEARIAVAHGQMSERQLEDRVLKFIDKGFDVLLSTTIIESGMDIPNVNTIFINDADLFGLAELHQLRGRVGRYKHTAYAYLLLPTDRPITPEAEKRLKAIEEFSELGAGFKIALRDLEIRGAGNILGAQQHGHVQAVGYEMFCQLLKSAVRRTRKEPSPPPSKDVSISLNLDSYLPQGYVPEESQKLEAYRKLSRCSSTEEIRDFEMELRDRFGPLPPEAKNLLAEKELRLAAQAHSVRSIVRKNGKVVMEVDDLRKAETGLYDVRHRIKVINGNTVHLELPSRDTSPEGAVRFLRKVFKLGV